MRGFAQWAALAFALLPLCPLLPAAELRLRVAGPDGAPVAGLVVTVAPVAGTARPAAPIAAVMDQLNRAFTPELQVIPVGSTVAFPNSDLVSHQVYSFSKPKRFQLPLYRGTAYPPLRFDEPGLVTLGCNIHDRMAAWVVVADTPWFARSAADGRARIDAVPAGSYRLHIWHPGLPPGAEPAAVALTVTSSDVEHHARLAVSAEP